MIICAAGHDLCGEGIALCGEARRSTTNISLNGSSGNCSGGGRFGGDRFGMFVAHVMEWQYLPMPGLFRARFFALWDLYKSGR